MEENRGELDELQSRVLEIQALLAKRAPVLGPRVVPKQLRAACNLFQICSTMQQRKAAEAFLASKAAELAADPADSSEKKEKDTLEGGVEKAGESSHRDVVLLETEMDIVTRRFRVTAAKFAGKIDGTLSDLDLLMELHLNAGRDELEPYAARFASANGFDFADRTAASALQEVCSLAYALHVAASNIGGWTGFIGSFQLPLANDVDMTALLQELFAAPSPPPESPRSHSRSKSKGAKRSSKKKKATAAGAAEGKGGVSGGKADGGKVAKESKRKR